MEDKNSTHKILRGKPGDKPGELEQSKNESRQGRGISETLKGTKKPHNYGPEGMGRGKLKPWYWTEGRNGKLENAGTGCT